MRTKGRAPERAQAEAQRAPGRVARHKITPGAIWTFRCVRNDRRIDRHYDTEAQAIEGALCAIERDIAEPVHIRAGKIIVYDADELYDMWASKYLQ